MNKRNINYFKDDISEIIIDSSKILKTMNNNGQYVYGYNTNKCTKIAGYNTLRYAGSTWSLILAYKYNPNEELKTVIENAIEYLISKYTIENDGKLFVILNNGLNLGGNGLALLMVSEYKDAFKDDKYDMYANKLARGIIYMQKENGSYNHVLNQDLSVNKEFSTVYYDGEATFALLKYYKNFKDDYYLNSAKRSIDYFINNNYEQYGDHWISYSMDEFIKYNLDEKYIDFAFLNYTNNKNVLDSKKSFGPTRLEMLMSTYDVYTYVLENKQDSASLKNIKVDELKNSIEINLNVLFNYHISEEIAMYMENPKLVLNGFHNINDNFRMRIDDIQHSLTAIIRYNDLILKKEDN